MKNDKFNLTEFITSVVVPIVFLIGLCFILCSLLELSKDADGTIRIVESNVSTLHILNNDGTTTDISAKKINDRNFETYDGRHISVPESTRWYYEERR